MKCFEFRMLYSSYGVTLISRTSKLCRRPLREVGYATAPRREATTYLSGHIDNLDCIILAVVLDRFAEGVLDGGVIAVDEQTVHELDGER